MARDRARDDFPPVMTPMGQAAASLNEQYLAYRGAGFNETQAMQLCAAIVTTSMQDAIDQGRRNRQPETDGPGQ